MEESEPEHSHSRDHLEDPQKEDTSLVSKLARAHSTLPLEERWILSLRKSEEQISNPELEKKFQKLLKQQEGLPAYHGHKVHNPDPAILELLEKRIEQLQPRGGNRSDDGFASMTSKEEIVSGIPSSSPCSKCGQVNPPSYRFCGSCGQKLERRGAIAAPAPEDRIRQPEIALERPQAESSKAPAETTASQRWLVMNLLFLALLIVLLAVVVGQQWFIWQQPWPATRTPMSAALSAHAPVAAARANSSQPRKSKVELQAGTEQPKSARRAGGSAAPAKNASKAAAKPPLKAVTQQPVAPTVGRVPGATRRSQEEPVPPVAIEAAGDLRLPVVVPATVPKLVEPAPKNASASQAPAEPARIQVSQGVAQGALIFKVDPDYPSIARNVRIQGPVVLQGVIAKDGTVKELRVLKGNAFLVGPAIQAVKKWRYRPYMLDGKPVEVETTITLNFKGE